LFLCVISPIYPLLFYPIAFLCFDKKNINNMFLKIYIKNIYYAVSAIWKCLYKLFRNHTRLDLNNTRIIYFCIVKRERRLICIFLGLCFHVNKVRRDNILIIYELPLQNCNKVWKVNITVFHNDYSKVISEQSYNKYHIINIINVATYINRKSY